jgi:hypothetical protein
MITEAADRNEPIGVKRQYAQRLKILGLGGHIAGRAARALVVNWSGLAFDWAEPRPYGAFLNELYSRIYSH